MYSNNLKRLRNEKEYTQSYVANILGCKRTTYNNWERGVVMIPIGIVDELSIFYKVSMSCILGVEKHIKYKNSIIKMSYTGLLSNLNYLKDKNKDTYAKIGNYIKCTGTTCQRYYSGKIVIPIDRLLMLCNMYNINIDVLCGKTNDENLVKN